MRTVLIHQYCIEISDIHSASLRIMTELCGIPPRTRTKDVTSLITIGMFTIIFTATHVWYSISHNDWHLDRVLMPIVGVCFKMSLSKK